MRTSLLEFTTKGTAGTWCVRLPAAFLLSGRSGATRSLTVWDESRFGSDPPFPRGKLLPSLSWEAVALTKSLL